MEIKAFYLLIFSNYFIEKFDKQIIKFTITFQKVLINYEIKRSMCLVVLRAISN